MESRPTPATQPLREWLGAFLTQREAWLMERVLGYARAQGYTAYTSTLLEAWRVSIVGLTQAIVAALDAYCGQPHEYPMAMTPGTDPIAAFAILEAGRHRHRGITLAMFWGLLKYYARAFLDSLDTPLPPGADAVSARAFLAECFARMEFSFVLEWTKLSGEEANTELGIENRILANEKNKYLTVFESVPQALFLLDASDHVENANAAALEMTGVCVPPGTVYYGSGDATDGTYRGIAGRPLTDLLPWTSQALADVGPHGVSKVALEATVDSATGKRYYSTLIGRLRDVTGNLSGKVVLCRDATPERLAEQALAQSEERYRVLADLMQQGLVILSPDGRIDFANSALEAMLGWPMEAIIGQPASAFIREEDRGRFAESLRERSNGATEPYEMGLLRRDGRMVFVMSSPSPVIGRDGDYQGSLEVFTDITRLKQLEIQLTTAKRLEAIGQLAGGVAHEINTPLQYVSGNLDFALANLPRLIELLGKYENALGFSGDKQAFQAARADIESFRRDNDMEMILAELPQALDESLHGAERVASFVRSIKRFAQTDGTGRRAIDVNEAILATVDVAKSAQEIPVCVETDLAEDVPALTCVPGDFNQLLLCLLLNASQAMERVGAPTGCVRVSSRREGNAVAVAVSDSGPGIPPELQTKIFSPFAAGKNGGQGLSIVLSIVEKHHGSIRCVSEPGRGATFHVSFPLD